MLLIKQEKLHFLDEKSDKVYEVELFHIQEDEYIVNFRYGRRGRKLTEGTKTVFPVSKEQADKIFDDLVSSKTKKGYQSVTEYTDINTNPVEIIDVEESGAIPVVLSYLEKRARGEMLGTNWRLSRIIWRAGELKISAAVPHVITLMPTLVDQEKYSAIWMMGRIANADCLKYLQAHPVNESELAYRIYNGALLNAGDKATYQTILDKLPLTLKTSLIAGNTTGFIESIKEYLFKLKVKDASFLLDVYYLCIQNTKLRAPFAEVLSEVSYAPGYWKYIRYIYKLAEMVEDGITFGMISSRVNIKNAFFTSPTYGDFVYVDNTRLKISEALSAYDAKLAFSNKTKNYFVRRTLRRLKKAGYDKQESYCAFASGILTAYSAADERNHPPMSTYSYNRETRSYNRQNMVFPSMAHSPFLYYILYSRGDRLQMPNKGKFHFSGEAVPQTNREDAFPHLWNKYPSYLVNTLVESKIEEVMTFALRILKSRSDLDSLFTIEQLVKLLQNPFEEAIEFSLTLVRKKYDANNPNEEIIFALIESENSKAIDLALELIDKNDSPFISNKSFVQKSLVIQNEKLHEWLRAKVKEDKFNEDEKKEIVDNTIAHFLEADEADTNTLTADSLTQIFKDHLSQIDDETILRMLDSPKIQVQLFAAKLINLSEKNPAEWPDEVLLKLINSEYAEIRNEGMILFGKLTDDELLKRTAFIGKLATSEHQDLRITSRTVIERLAPIDKQFSEKIFLKLFRTLLINHEDEELPIDVYDTIENHLMAATYMLENEDLDELLKSDKREIHLLTHDYLQKHAKLDQWPVGRIALLGNHDMKSVRELGYKYFEEHVDKMKFHKYEAIRILDSDWEETRKFGRKFFDSHFDEKTWEPGLIVALCDSIRPETQDYGTRILGQYFKDENGIQYLTALSEHPDSTIQLYTTNYLDKYAFNNMDLLHRLKPYFKRILSTINTRRAAKLRVEYFLKKQANEGQEQAQYVAGVINEVIGTIAVRENENYISILYDIHNKYPELKTEIETIPLEIRS